jgi:ribosomal protein L37AE/L43A
MAKRIFTMPYRYVPDRSQPAEPPPAPSQCPRCGSSDVMTTKAITAESYWRCVSCGEIWNVSRRTARRQGPYGSFRG